jgi:hypothetical protein
MKPNLPSHFKFTLIVVALVLGVSAGGLIPKSAHAAPGDLFASINGDYQNRGGSISHYTAAGTKSTFGPPLDRARGTSFDSVRNLFVATTTLDKSLPRLSGGVK